MLPDWVVSASYLLVFLLAFALTLFLVPITRWLSFKLGAVSRPGGRRREATPMPKLGGIALFTAFTVSVLAAQSLPVQRLDPNEVTRLTGMLLGGAIIFVVGLIDDFYELSYIVQAAGQVAAAIVAIAFQIFIEYFNNPFTGEQTPEWGMPVTVILTLFWMGLMMNTVNFLDGADGLAAGVCGIAGVMLFLNGAYFVEPAQASVSLLHLALVGICAGFLVYNFYPAQIYLGGGALYLGYLVGTLSIIGGAKMATILLVMGLPLMDLAWQAANRLRQGRSPFRGDRGHLHFRLLDSGLMTVRQLALSYYAFCAFFGMLTLVLESQLYKFVAFSVMLILVAVGFAMVSRVRMTQSIRDVYSSPSSE
jgi:UDP-GlcNAc:undecaprenyl-phosphate GlcNAc-1-phosphate transferase